MGMDLVPSKGTFMAMTEKIMWKLYAGAAGAVTTMVVQKTITKVWEAATGEPPPDPNDPEAPLVNGLIWAAASGLGVGVAQLVMNRYVHRRWMANYSHNGPGKLRSRLT